MSLKIEKDSMLSGIGDSKSRETKSNGNACGDKYDEPTPKSLFGRLSLRFKSLEVSPEKSQDVNMESSHYLSYCNIQSTENPNQPSCSTEYPQNKKYDSGFIKKGVVDKKKVRLSNPIYDNGNKNDDTIRKIMKKNEDIETQKHIDEAYAVFTEQNEDCDQKISNDEYMTRNYESMSLMEIIKSQNTEHSPDNHSCTANSGKCTISYTKGQEFGLSQFRERYIATGDIFVCTIDKTVHVCTNEECDKMDSHNGSLTCQITGRSRHIVQNDYSALNPMGKLEFNDYGVSGMYSSKGTSIEGDNFMTSDDGKNLNPNNDSIFEREMYNEPKHPHQNNDFASKSANLSLMVMGQDDVDPNDRLFALDIIGNRSNSAPPDISRHRNVSKGKPGTWKRTKRITSELRRNAMMRSAHANNTKLSKVIHYGDDNFNSEMQVLIIHNNTEYNIVMRNFHHELELDVAFSTRLGNTCSSPSTSSPSSTNGEFYPEANKFEAEYLDSVIFDTNTSGEKSTNVRAQSTPPLAMFANDGMKDGNGNISQSKMSILLNQYRCESTQYMIPITVLGENEREILEKKHPTQKKCEDLSCFYVAISDISRNVEMASGRKNTILRNPMAHSYIKDVCLDIQKARNGDLEETCPWNNSNSSSSSISNSSSSMDDDSNNEGDDNSESLSNSLRSLSGRVRSTNFRKYNQTNKKRGIKKEYLRKAFEKSSSRKLMDYSYVDIFHDFFDKMGISTDVFYHQETYEESSFNIIVYKMKSVLYNRYQIQILEYVGNNRFYLIKDVFALYERGIFPLYFAYKKKFMNRESACVDRYQKKRSVEIGKNTITQMLSLRKNINKKHQIAGNMVFKCVYSSKMFNEQKIRAELFKKKSKKDLNLYLKNCKSGKSNFTLFEAWMEFATPVFENEQKSPKDLVQAADRILSDNSVIDYYADIIIHTWKTLVIGPTSLIQSIQAITNSGSFEKHCIAVIYKLASGFSKTVELDKNRLMEITGITDENEFKTCFPDNVTSIDLQILPQDKLLKKALVHLTNLGTMNENIFSVYSKKGNVKDNRNPISVSTSNLSNESYHRWRDNKKKKKSALFTSSDSDLKQLPSLKRERETMKRENSNEEDETGLNNGGKGIRMKSFRIDITGKANGNKSSRGKYSRSERPRFARKYCRTTCQSFCRAYSADIKFSLDVFYRTVEHITNHWDSIESHIHNLLQQEMGSGQDQECFHDIPDLDEIRIHRIEDLRAVTQSFVNHIKSL